MGNFEKKSLPSVRSASVRRLFKFENILFPWNCRNRQQAIYSTLSSFIRNLLHLVYYRDIDFFFFYHYGRRQITIHRYQLVAGNLKFHRYQMVVGNLKFIDIKWQHES